MKVSVFESPTQDLVIIPARFINDLDNIDSMIGSSGRLFYKVYKDSGSKRKQLIVCAKEYREEDAVYLPKGLLNFLEVERGDKVSIARHFGQVPKVKSLKFKPLEGTGFYRSVDVRSLIERALMDVPVLHRGVVYSIGNVCKLELVELVTSKGPELHGVVTSDEDIALDFAPNDEFYQTYLEELETEKKQREDEEIKRWDEMIKFRREGGLIFGISGEFLKYINSKQQQKTPDVDKWSTMKGRTLDD